MNTFQKACFSLLFCFFVFAANSRGDDYHYINMLVGNRAAGLGGAYTALSDDPAGCYYNPAGIALVPRSSLSASVNAFNLSEKKYRKALLDTGGNRLDWNQESSSILPNFFGVVRKIGKGVAGFSYAVSDSVQRRQKQNFTNINSIYPANPIKNFSINIDDSDKTYFLGPSYALRISDSFSIGVTAYFYYRDQELIRNQLLVFEKGEHYLLNYYETRSDWGVKPTLGFMWEPMEKLALGLTLSKIFISASDHDTQEILRDTSSGSPVVMGGDSYDFSNTDTIYFSNSSTNEKNDLPFNLSLGAAYFVSPRLLFSSDLRFYQSMNEKEAVLNIALGTEYYLTDTFAVRAGFFTDRANTPSISSSMTNQLEHVDIYGADLSFTIFGGMSSITFGVSAGMGGGEAQIISNSASAQDLDVMNINLYLSAEYSY